MVEEPAHPYTLALSFVTYSIHSIIPVAGADQRQAMASQREASIDGARAVLEHGGAIGGYFRREVGLALAFREWLSFQKGHNLFEHVRITSRLNVVRDGIRQPEQVVGDSCAHASAGGWMPPVLDISFQELSRRGAQKLLAGHITLRGCERHHILKLVAKAVSTACLVKCRARPDPARQRLVEKPAIYQNIHSPVGCLHLESADDVIPVCHDRLQDAVQIRPAIPGNQGMGLFPGSSLAQQKNNLHPRTGSQLQYGLQRAAWIQTSPYPSQ